MNAQIGSQLSAQEAAVRQAREALDKAIEERNNTIAKMRANNVSYGQIAKIMGISRPGVMGICRKNEVQLPIKE